MVAERPNLAVLRSGLIEQVNEDAAAVEILSKRDDPVVKSAAEYRSLQETAHLLRAPANAKQLTGSLESLAAEVLVGRGMVAADY